MSDNPFSRGRLDTQTRARVDELERRRRASESGDVVVDGGRRLILRSPNGNYWVIAVDNTGALTTALTTPP